MLQQHSECKFLCITEHWKSEQQLQTYGIEKFKLVCSYCRKEGQHGGAAIYADKQLRFKVRSKLNKLSICGEFECAVAEFMLDKNNIIVIVIYRPPNGSLTIFFNKLEQLLCEVLEENKLIFLAGDFNIEMINNNSNRTQLMLLLNSFALYATVNEYTRITQNSKSCIDNIFTNYTDEYHVNILNTHVSDHTAQKISFKIQLNKKQCFMYRRFFSEANKQKFLEYLHEETWLEVYNCNNCNVNEQWTLFINNFLNIFNYCFPQKLVDFRTKNCVHLEDQEFKSCKNRLDTLLTLYNNNNVYKEMYNATKKEYNNLLLRAKQKMFENRIINSDNKSKCMWSIHNEITGKPEKNENFPVHTDAVKIVNEYNKHLLNIVPELLKTIKNIPFDCQIENNTQSMYLKKITPNKISDLANNLKNKYSSGEDDIPTSIIKFCINEIKEVLCYIINNSFKYGIFPEQLKLAVIKPIYKKGDPELLENYRPISLLPSFSKLFEICMCANITPFMNDCHLFSPTQHGYLGGRSTQTAIFQFTQNIQNFIENDKIALGVFLDLSKAYDCLNHEILFIKLEKYGIRGNALAWIKSFLSNRRQRVKVITDGQIAKSDILYANNIGIPQGSIMGPVLFIIFVNDLCNVTTNKNQCITNYADDNNLLMGAATYPELVEECNNLFSSTSDWYHKNRFILNKEKTNIILFRTKQAKIVTPQNINIADEEIKLVENTKFLGLHIDEHLSWEVQIDDLCSKMNKICYSIRVISKYLNDKSIKIIYFSNFESIARYGIIFWGSNVNIQKTFIIQKRIVRIIQKIRYHETCRGVFKSNKIMTMYALYIYECLIFIFKHKNDYFVNSTEHSYNTRALDIMYPKHTLTLTEKSTYYRSIKFYNKLPNNLKLLESFNCFKKEVKKLLINLEPYTLNEYLLS